MRYRQTAVWAAIAVIFVALACPPVNADGSTVTAKTKSVAAFKNGLGFFIREGEAKLTDGWAMTEIVPQAALGTYWIGSSKPGITIERLTALQEDVSRTIPAVSVQEVLAANIGKKVRVMIGDKMIEGKLVAVPEDRKVDPDRPTYPVYTSLIPNTQSQLALIETQTGTVAINKHSISWVEFEGPANAEYVAKEKVKRFRFKVAGAKDSAPVTIGYLQKGISWAPAYMVDLVDEKKARITMQGLLANDVEDIDGAEVYFVVGYPNFVFGDTLSPLALGQSVSEFVERIGRPASSARYAGVASQMSNSASYDYAAEAAAPSFGYTTAGTPGATEEDLFLYRMKDVSLKKGERAYYTVFTAEVPYEHVYEWVVPDTSNVQSSGYLDSSRQNPNENMEEQVWHKLKMTNNSNYPWTTAPGMAMSNGQPLAQDTLNYTPKGAQGDLKLTVATDIRGKKSEMEKSRENDALRLLGNTFSKVTTDGELTLKNFKAKDVTVIVKKTVTGEVITTNLDGKAQKTAQGVKAVNPTSVITWEIPLKVGEEKKLTYTYFTYIRL